MRTSRVLAAVVFLCTISAALAAQGWIDPVRPPPGPPVSNGPIERLRSAVQVSISGRVARVSVEEWFRNNGPTLNEGVYHFPLPGEAVFSSYSLWQGDQELRGEAMDAAQARAIYEAIVRQKRDPALIELAGQGLIRARVFPIAPGETRKITLKYTQLLDRAGDAWRFRYLGDRNRQTAPRSFRLEVDSAAHFGDPYSPTHQVQVTRRDDRLEVTLSEGGAAAGDFELLLPLARERAMGVIAKRPLANAAWRYARKPAKSYHQSYWSRLRTLDYEFLKAAPDTAVGTALRFTLAVPGVHTAIVGTTKVERWQQNAALLGAGAPPRDAFERIRARWRAVADASWVGQV